MIFFLNKILWSLVEHPHLLLWSLVEQPHLLLWSLVEHPPSPFVVTSGTPPSPFMVTSGTTPSPFVVSRTKDHFEWQNEQVPFSRVSGPMLNPLKSLSIFWII